MKIETFALERWMVAHELDVEYDITESGIYPMSVEELIGLDPNAERGVTVAELMETRLGYSEACGSHDLRSEIAATYTDTVPENILITTGAIEANFLLFNALLEPGDHVVAVHPAYQQLYSVPRAIGCEVDLWRLTPESGFHFDLEALKRLLREETKLIVINTPHNPTGAALIQDQLWEIYDLAARYDTWVLSDEAYRWLNLPGMEPLAGPARDLGPRAISTGTFSKPFGLPGLRIGWLAAPEEIRDACWSLRDYLSLSPGKLNDRLALIAFQHRDLIVERNQRIIEQNLHTTLRWLDDNAGEVSWRPPHGGLLALLEYRLDIPSMDLANRLADEYSVMLAPGSAFDYEYHLRLGLGQRPDIFAEGLERVAACFADLRAAGVGDREERNMT